MTTDTNIYYGQTDPATGQGDWNQMLFVIQQQMLGLNTSLPVKVLSVDAVGVNPVGFVSIQILVDQITGDDKTVPHGEIPNVPYFRLQGGTNAVIIDPKVDDIGIACFSSRDISAVKNARQEAPPGSRRAHDFSDAMYVGGFLNGMPTQYIHFIEGGIIVHSPTKVRAESPLIEMDSNSVKLGDLSQTVRALVDERIVAAFNGHTHASGGAGVPNTPIVASNITTTHTKAN